MPQFLDNLLTDGGVLVLNYEYVLRHEDVWGVSFNSALVVGE
jgi:hypothetical protein